MGTPNTKLFCEISNAGKGGCVQVKVLVVGREATCSIDECRRRSMFHSLTHHWIGLRAMLSCHSLHQS
jgi:hypothetical protein